MPIASPEEGAHLLVTLAYNALLKSRSPQDAQAMLLEMASGRLSDLPDFQGYTITLTPGVEPSSTPKRATPRTKRTAKKVPRPVRSSVR